MRFVAPFQVVECGFLDPSLQAGGKVGLLSLKVPTVF
jgi:hypothetical protein